MSLTPDDEDLRVLFARQRRADHADAPAWRGVWPRACTPAPQRAAVRWVPMLLGAACIVLVVWLPSLKPKQTLSETLPPLFDGSSDELFADLGPSFTVLDSPSDFLLPDHLHSNLNLFSRP